MAVSTLKYASPVSSLLSITLKQSPPSYSLPLYLSVYLSNLCHNRINESSMKWYLHQPRTERTLSKSNDGYCAHYGVVQIKEKFYLLLDTDAPGAGFSFLTLCFPERRTWRRIGKTI